MGEGDLKRNDLAFVNCTVINGYPTAKPLENAAVLVKNLSSEDERIGKILKVGKEGEIAIPSGFKIIDLQRKFVLPGLINAHVHLIGSGKPRKMVSNEKSMKRLVKLARTWLGRKVAIRMMRKNITNAINAGVTTIRAMGDPHYYDVRIRKDIESGKCLGPRLLVAGLPLCVTGGHGSVMAHIVDSPTESRRAVRKNLREEVDCLKLIATGGVMDARKVGEAGRPQMTVEEISAACDEAHRAGLLVAAHAESTTGVKESLLGGVDTIEHGADLDDECINLFKHNQKSLRGFSALIPTLSAGIAVSGLSREKTKITDIQRENAHHIKEGCIKGLQRALQEGIKVGIGTDASIPYVTHYNVWKELDYFIRYGNLTPQQAISIASLGNAEILGIDNETGTIEVGKSADFFIVDGNPLEDISVLAQPTMVVIFGQLIEKPKIKPIKAIN